MAILIEGLPHHPCLTIGRKQYQLSEPEPGRLEVEGMELELELIAEELAPSANLELLVLKVLRRELSEQPGLERLMWRLQRELWAERANDSMLGTAMVLRMIQTGFRQELAAGEIFSITLPPELEEALLDFPLVFGQMLVASVTRDERRQLRLAASLSDDVRHALAINPYLVLACQKRLVQDANADVRVRLACNRCLQEEIQLRLTQDGRVMVRKGLAANPSLSEEAKELLSHDQSQSVRGRIEFERRRSMQAPGL